MMPENWTPGKDLILPDPTDPTGKRKIIIPASEIDILG
jgi:hypothetical protein